MKERYLDGEKVKERCKMYVKERCEKGVLSFKKRKK
jgi:hypothetical protein